MTLEKAPPSTQLGRYILIQKIATGGVADIYLAKAKTAQQRDKYLVLKCLRADATADDNFLETILNEAQLAVRLRHPNVVTVFDLCETDGYQFLAMEYLDSRDLASVFKAHIQRDDYLPFELALYAVREVAAGLHYVHELCDQEGRFLGLVHRDISSQNILLSSSGDIKISDFGIAKTNFMQNRTPSGIIKGKFHYMSPEQAWGDRVDRRSDIFSLGIILYEAIVGQEAYPYEDVLLLIDKARIAQIPKPSDVRPGIPEDLEAIILKALDIDKNARYQTAKEFAEAIDAYLRQQFLYVDRASWVNHISSLQLAGTKLPLLRAHEYVRDIHSLLPAHLENGPIQVSEDIEITEQYAVDDVQRAIDEREISQKHNLLQIKLGKNRPFSVLYYYGIVFILLLAVIFTILYFFVF